MRTLALTCLALLPLAGCESRQPVADLVVRNADVRTMEAASPAATALAVANGKLVFIGTDLDVDAWIGLDTTVIDAGGHTVLPGLIDSHIHAAEGALALGGCTLHNQQLTIEQAAEPIRACVAAD